MRDLIREKLRGTPLFRPVRDAYFWMFNRECLRERRGLEAFYGQFVRPGTLVFDVGANMGQRSEVFLDLGATVVAIEPNPECVKRLKTLRSRKLIIEPVAVGPEQGFAQLNLSHWNGLSTLSEEWRQVASEKYGWKWTQITVPVVDLESLVRKHGLPTFIKIDVEGFELQVLKGLRTRPRLVSFEFHADFVSYSEECLGLPLFDASSVYNLVREEEPEFSFAEWLPRDAILRALRSKALPTYGDLWVRFIHTHRPN